MVLLSAVNRLKPKINLEYPNLCKFKYLSSIFAIDCNSSINYCNYFIFYETVTFCHYSSLKYVQSIFLAWVYSWNVLIFKATFSLNILSLYANKKRIYLPNVGIKAYLLYSEKIQCNTGTSIVSLYSKHDQSL